MDGTHPHLPRPRDPADGPGPLSREYVTRLGRLSAAVVLAGTLLAAEEDERRAGPGLVGFGVSDNPDRIGG